MKMVGASLSLLSLFFLISVSLLVFLRLILRPRPVRIPIKNSHVFITGGSSGIGLALAHQAVLQGAAQVSILARNRAKLVEAKHSIKQATGFEVSTYSVDVRDFDAVKKAVNDAGPIDVLVCNQGVFIARELERSSMEDVESMININLTGTFYLIKAALASMKSRADRRPTSIAIVSSQGGQVGIYGYTAYSATKFGLRGMAEALQQEVIGDNIHVSLILPPNTDTPGLVEDRKRRPELTKTIAASTSEMTADEVAKISLDGIKSGSFFVTCDYIGYLLSIATAGLSPQR